MKVKDVNVDGLSKEHVAKLKVHALHHTRTHIALMVKYLKEGISFDQAHEEAMEQVGY